MLKKFTIPYQLKIGTLALFTGAASLFSSCDKAESSELKEDPVKTQLESDYKANKDSCLYVYGKKASALSAFKKRVDNKISSGTDSVDAYKTTADVLVVPGVTGGNQDIVQGVQRTGQKALDLKTQLDTYER